MKFAPQLLAWVAIAATLQATFGQSNSTINSRVSAADIPEVGRLPESDEGLPGAGPIRRYDWFRELWRTRRVAWSHRVQQDKGAVVFLGDSITQLWGDNLGGNFPEWKVANRGISGDTTRGVLIRLKVDVLTLHPSGVVLLIGTNDLEENADPETIASNMRLILDALEASNLRMPIILCKVFPSSASMKRPAEKIRKVNELYSGLVKHDRRVTLLDTWSIFANESGDAKPSEFPDLLHPNKIGYAKWAAALKPELEKLVPHNAETPSPAPSRPEHALRGG